MDFGSTREDLAADVDDGIAEEDLEALDSDEEYEDDPDSLFEGREEDSDSKFGKSLFCISRSERNVSVQLPCTYCRFTPCCLRTSRCGSSSLLQTVIVWSLLRPMLLKLPSLFLIYAMSLTAAWRKSVPTIRAATYKVLMFHGSAERLPHREPVELVVQAQDIVTASILPTFLKHASLSMVLLRFFERL